MQGFIWFMCCYGWIPGFYAPKENTLLTGPHPQLLLMEESIPTFYSDLLSLKLTTLFGRDILRKLVILIHKALHLKVGGECPSAS